MKKLILVALEILLIIFAVIGCSFDKANDVQTNIDNSEDEEVKTIADEINNDDKKEIDTDTKNEEGTLNFRDELRNLELSRYIYDEGSELTEKEWIKKWLEYTYKDYGVLDIKSQILKRHPKFIDENLTVNINKVFIQFNCKKQINNKLKNDNNLYTDEIYLVQASVDNKIEYYIDVINNTNLSYAELFSYALDVVSKDDRFSDNQNITKYFEENPNANSIANTIDQNTILPGYSLYDVLVNDKDLILLMGKVVEIEDNGSLMHNLKVCYFDYNNNKVTKTIDVGNQIYNKSHDTSKIGFIANIGYEKANDISIDYLIDIDGNIVQYNKKDKNKLYSEDNNYYAFSDNNGNLIIKNTQKDEVIVTLESVSDENLNLSEYNSYYPYGWLDNENCIYCMSGYEWSNGFGIVNIKTGENIKFDKSRGQCIYKIVNNRIYSNKLPYGADVFPYSLGYYDLNIKPYEYVELYDAEKYLEAYEYDAEKHRETYESEGMYLEFSRRFSSDFSKLFIWAYNHYKHEYFAKIFSLDSKSVEKDMRFGANNFLPGDYIDNSFIIDDKILIIKDEFNIYVVDLDR
ncbi:hypothetical protein JYG23_02160 [Sedimentibacter sp. zth1]|uniref:hypothetical protein n=1 Tax=Sedimentibacter sp. zth1 TaxID=2816908 RepID=UPI001A90D4F9|nr:hypothetical protein [Sedimentibacter sp. zth1]QSX06286.1 hypothetical protein JYG23_02160 [Sedimentibacter sp. zth1]